MEFGWFKLRDVILQACGEARLTVAVGQAVLVSKSEGSWAHGSSLSATQRTCCNAEHVVHVVVVVVVFVVGGRGDLR